MKHVVPSVTQTAFSCPHCGALAKQFWFSLYANEQEDNHPLPIVLTNQDEDWTFADIEDEDRRIKFRKWAEKMLSGLPFLEYRNDTMYSKWNVCNTSLSRCFNCKDVSLWIFDRLVYPQAGDAPPPNPDMPQEIRRDYDEASSIIEKSPRGAAALVRLCIQKLCKELGQLGENINSDIAALVAGGLDPRVQKALDAVRVIGNHAVHPGQIDLRDDRATAESLFRLLNLIVEKTISEPKHVDEVYDLLPDSAKEAIKKRDGIK